MATQESGETPETPSVNLREVWPNETSDFTPWLAENLHLLGDALDMKLRLIQSEAYGYGGFTDILAESDEHERVVIENQLEPSDNDHFIRLMGYGCGPQGQRPGLGGAPVLVISPEAAGMAQGGDGWQQENLCGRAATRPGRRVASRRWRPDNFRIQPRILPSALHNNWPEWSELTTYRDSDARQRYRDFFQTIIGELRRRGMTDQ